MIYDWEVSACLPQTKTTDSIGKSNVSMDALMTQDYTDSLETVLIL